MGGIVAQANTSLIQLKRMTSLASRPAGGLLNKTSATARQRLKPAFFLISILINNQILPRHYDTVKCKSLSFVEYPQRMLTVRPSTDEVREESRRPKYVILWRGEMEPNRRYETGAAVRCRNFLLESTGRALSICGAMRLRGVSSLPDVMDHRGPKPSSGWLTDIGRPRQKTRFRRTATRRRAGHIIYSWGTVPCRLQNCWRLNRHRCPEAGDNLAIL